MKTKHFEKILTLITTVALTFGITAPTTGQQEEIDPQAQRTASIERMRDRIAEINKEIKRSAAERTQTLGEEAFGLINQIEQTYLQIEDAYQNQVVELNARMRLMWEKLESTENIDRESLDKKLQILQTDWDRIYKRLTRAHDSHLDQLQDDLANLRSELSTAAGRAQTEVEESRFESLARWERTHEVFLKLNQTYIKTIADQLKQLQRRSQQEPGNRQLTKGLNSLRNRFFTLQERLQKRITSHLEHLDNELDVRQLQFAVTTRSDARKSIQLLLDQLGQRTHATFVSLEDSYRDTIAALEAVSDQITAELKNTDENQKGDLQDQLVELQDEIDNTKSLLKSCYVNRTKFIDKQISQRQRSLRGLGKEEKNDVAATIENLRALSATLTEKATRL